MSFSRAGLWRFASADWLRGFLGGGRSGVDQKEVSAAKIRRVHANETMELRYDRCQGGPGDFQKSFAAELAPRASADVPFETGIDP